MKKEIEFKMKRVFDYHLIENNYIVFRETVFAGDNKISERENISTIENLENLTENEQLKIEPYFLCNKDILEFHRQNLTFADGDKVNQFIVNKPYSLIEEQGLTDQYKLLSMSSYDHNIYDVYGKKYPKAFCFNYFHFTGAITNRYYDLEEVLEILKKRNDIKFIDDDKILQIPYYNANPEEYQYLSFLWIPSDEDFEKIKHLSNDLAYQFIKDNILCLPYKENNK